MEANTLSRDTRRGLQIWTKGGGKEEEEEESVSSNPVGSVFRLSVVVPPATGSARKTEQVLPYVNRIIDCEKRTARYGRWTPDGPFPKTFVGRF